MCKTEPLQEQLEFKTKTGAIQFTVINTLQSVKMSCFLARGELSRWLGNQHVRRKQWKFVIDFRSS